MKKNGFTVFPEAFVLLAVPMLVAACGPRLHQQQLPSVKRQQPQRFIAIEHHYFSDAGPGECANIIEVEQMGVDVRVRGIRVWEEGPLLCPRAIVSAAEHIWPNRTVDQVADVCACTPTCSGG